MKKFIISTSLILIIFSTIFLNISLCNEIDIQDNEKDLDISQIQEAFSNVEKNINISSRSCIVLDRISKKSLYEKNSNNKVKMASTTKIMTAVIVIENMDLTTTVEVSKKAANTRGSRLGLKTGDKITIHDLLYGLMLCSGNDAAVALAEAVSGSVQDFAQLMNSKAKQLNLNNTNFESPHGLDSDEHYTTPYELALLSDYALTNPVFLQIVGTKNYTVTINGYPKSLSNTNELLGNLHGIYGIKTGFTNGANRCLVTACKRNDMDIICVVLGADTKKIRTQDSIKLIEFTFNTFEYFNIQNLANDSLSKWEKNNLNLFSIKKGTSNTIDLQLGNIQTPIVPLKKDDIKDIKIDIDVYNDMIAPIKQNDYLGSVRIYINDTIIDNIDILSNTNIDKKDSFYYFSYFFKNYTSILSLNI